MELYNDVSYRLAEVTTKSYSTSFSLSSSLFDTSIRRHIYAIYGLVRIADEIVDTYMGADSEALLNELETHVLTQLETTQAFSANPIVHAFVDTAQKYAIDIELIQPFFESMRTDLTEKTFTKETYDRYIYGSAEVIGLMCLRVFTGSNTSLYEQLKPGALALGRAYQKVNFLRDMRADYVERGRVYFPGVEFESFTVIQKQAIEADIEKDFQLAATALSQLPKNARKAVVTSYDYYWRLFVILKKASVSDITSRRLRVPTLQKLGVFAKAKVSHL